MYTYPLGSWILIHQGVGDYLESMLLKKNVDSQDPDPEIFLWVILMHQAQRPHFVSYTHRPQLFHDWWLYNGCLMLDWRQTLTKCQQRSAPERSREWTWFQIFHIQATPTPTKNLFCYPGSIFLSPWQCGNNLAFHRDSAYFKWQKLPRKDKGDRDGLGGSKT